MADDTNTIIGETILVRGNLQGDEDLTVQGRIEGSINLSKTLIIEPSGVVKADASINNAVISGVMMGNLSASDSVEITETGRMLGDISAPRVIIVEGALFKGKVDMGNLEMPRPASSSTNDRKPSYTPRPMPKSEPAVEASKPVARPPAKPMARPLAKKKPVAAPPKRSLKKKAHRSKIRSKKKVVVKKKRRR
ncbi:MAG: polymer-forming cytoskeletal protein [Deltaproteobacteria bacterium]|nr:polymer-forming cytoskeletal protein [Deltaproteobacteria bacterium]